MVVNIELETEELTIFFNQSKKCMKLTGEELLTAIYLYANTKAEMEEANEATNDSVRKG